MTATDAGLASQITETIDAALAKGETQDLGELLAVTNEYVGHVNSSDARAAAPKPPCSATACSP